MIEAISAYPTAPLMLVLCVPLTFGLFSYFPPYRAAFLSLLVSMLLLPVGYGWEIPGLTVLDKASLPVLSSIAACLFLAPTEFRYLRVRGAMLFIVTAFVVSPMLTAYTNRDPYSMGGFAMPGLTTWDGYGLFRSWAFVFLLPFLLGRMLVREVRQLDYLLRLLVIGLLIYSIPMLWEVRMSPQLHNTVYGYFPHSFLQQMRDGGFRPVVFFGHGLGLAIFTAFGVLGSVVLWRRGRKIRNLPPPLVTLYLGALLVLCKTLSALVYSAVGGVLMFFGSAKAQARAAVLIASIVLTYPLLRSFDLFPTTLLTRLSGSASEERSDSLAFRFKNEDVLLAHARERLWFGWGGYGRNRVYSEGDDTTVTDGLWIILLGDVGALGFASIFGLMLVPVFQTGRALRNLRSAADQRLLASVALLVALNWADSLPNALSGGVIMIFLTGAFSGVVATHQTAVSTQPARRKVPIPAAAHLGPPDEFR